LDKIAAIVDATLQTKPARMTHWSCRTMAQSQGVGKSTVNNIWRAHNLQPHRTETFKLSRDPKFLKKMTDVVGLRKEPDSDIESPLWRHYRARSSANAMRDTGIESKDAAETSSSVRVSLHPHQFHRLGTRIPNPSCGPRPPP
jgi:hypothetical protein